MAWSSSNGGVLAELARDEVQPDGSQAYRVEDNLHAPPAALMDIVRRWISRDVVAAHPNASHLLLAELAVDEDEDVAQLGSTTKAPASSPRSLAYRFIASLLTVTVNDRHVWDARNEFIDSSGDWWPGDHEVNHFTDVFPEVRRDFVFVPAIGLGHEPASHFWAILRDQLPVAIVSIEGRVYRQDRHYDVAEEYVANGRRMLPLVASVLRDLLP